MKLPRILIFTVTYSGKDYVLNKFLSHVRKIDYPNCKHIMIDNSTDAKYLTKLKRLGVTAFRVERGNTSREAITRAQNFARRYAIDNDYDYILSLESDVLVPKDIVQRLLKHNKDVVSGVYYIGDKSKGIQVPCITIPEYNKSINAFGTRILYQEEFPQYKNQGLKQVHAGSFGVCLIYKNVFKRFPFKFDSRFGGHSDIYFYNDLFNNKIPSFVDTNLYCEHENVSWDTVSDR